MRTAFIGHHRVWSVLLACLATLAVRPGVVIAQPCGGMVDLGTLGGTVSSARGISADGSVVVGEARNLANQDRAFRWTAAGGMVDLGTLGGTSSFARGISADGSVVVGRAVGGGGAFRWTAEGGMQDLGTLDGGSWAEATDVSADGSVVVGVAGNSADQGRAFRWTAAGGMVDLGTLGEYRSKANGVSADGSVVVGWAWNSVFNTRAFRWTAGGGMEDLGTLGGPSSIANGISADGSVVVGWAGGGGAFRWTAEGGMQNLGTLDGGGWAEATDVSADGSVVVGWAHNSVGQSRAFRWTAADGMVDLGTLGGSSSNALGVSADGSVVVGWARIAGTEHARAFRWTDALLRRIDPRDSVNETAHQTTRYSINVPHDNAEQRTILRRGSRLDPLVGTADFAVTVAACFDPAQHRLSFMADHSFDGGFETIPIPVYDDQVPPGLWGCVVHELGPEHAGERIATMRVFIPADAPVGEYAFWAVVDSPSDDRLDEMTFDRPVVVLFNPWDPQCETYLDGSAERNEYVLADQGIMWQGTARSRYLKPWAYAQFSEDVFLATLDLLEGLDANQRSSAVTVSRWLSQKLDAHDGGVLVGNWSGDYSGGTPPLSWTSSEAIFAAYRASGSEVRFGQCWVYGGILTSSLRTLGIPTRPVTNFESAHDSTNPPDHLIERCWVWDAAAGRWRNSGEGVWNYHVWCEAWMRRDDLNGYHGWQVVDATPQERSAETSPSRYQLGPAPVSAVLARTYVSFDSAFVMSEVDAELQKHENRDGVCVPIGSRDTTRVGRRITTKAVGAFGGIDITASYKTPETTPDPRGVPEVQIEIPESLPLGQTLHANVTIRNLDAEEREFHTYILVRSRAQNGNEIGVVVGPHVELLAIAGGGVATLPFTVPWTLLQPWAPLSEFVEFDIVVTRVHDEHRWFEQGNVVLRGLPVDVWLAPGDRVGLGGEVAASITYSNPLSAPLEGVVLTLTGGTGLLLGGTESSEQIPLGTLGAGEEGMVQRVLVANLEGEQMFAAKLFAESTLPGDAFAVVTVTNCAADLNGDGVLDLADIVQFITAFMNQDPIADLAEPFGLFDLADITTFVKLFQAGCP